MFTYHFASLTTQKRSQSTTKVAIHACLDFFTNLKPSSQTNQNSTAKIRQQPNLIKPYSDKVNCFVLSLSNGIETSNSHDISYDLRNNFSPTFNNLDNEVSLHLLERRRTCWWKTYVTIEFADIT